MNKIEVWCFDGYDIIRLKDGDFYCKRLYVPNPQQGIGQVLLPLDFASILGEPEIANWNAHYMVEDEDLALQIRQAIKQMNMKNADIVVPENNIILPGE